MLSPRFMTDVQLIKSLGITKAVLKACRGRADFPQRDTLAKKTDIKAVHAFFDMRSGLVMGTPLLKSDGVETFE